MNTPNDDSITAAVIELATAAIDDWNELGRPALAALTRNPELHAAVTERLAHIVALDIRRVAELVDRDPHALMAELAIAWITDPDWKEPAP
ncbi:hypothetical protein [Desertimonas flava]|uniref:hypothetical protein n=1 Tax=Desertimonas flava TaxID=2064846 RepID=UPI000E340FFA|nr:hypothetical protein [Desertimonas flava]